MSIYIGGFLYFSFGGKGAISSNYFIALKFKKKKEKLF